MDLNFSIEKVINWFELVPPSVQPAMLTAFATIIGAFIGACVAQYFSHKLTLKRENQKYEREVYEKLFAPILSETYAYLDIATHFRRGHDVKPGVNEEEIKEKIIKHIGSNLMYARPRLISAYNSAMVFQYQDDMSGFYYRVYELELIETFLNELIYLLRKTKMFDKKSYAQVRTTMFLYRLWSLYTKYFNCYEDANSLLGYKFYYDYKCLTMKNYKRIKRRTNPEYILNRIRRFVLVKVLKKEETYFQIDINYILNIVTSKEEDRVEIEKVLQFISNEK